MSVLARVLYVYKVREVQSLILYVWATLEALWDCEMKGAVEMHWVR